MIFVHDKGQMCNNILQYAHVFAWARENNRSCMSMRFAYKYQFFHICNSRYHNFLMYLIGKYGGKTHILPTIHYDLTQSGKEEKERFVLSHNNVIIEGWGLRYYDLFIKHIAEIRSLFRFKPEIESKVHEMINGDNATLRIGVHVRRGDYKTFMNGRFYFDDKAFLHYIKETIRLFGNQENTVVYVCGNDPNLNRKLYTDALGGITVKFPSGNPGEDLCLLSHCNYLIGPASSFSLIATMYNKAKLCWMSKPNISLRADDFKPFEYQFRVFDDLFK